MKNKLILYIESRKPVIENGEEKWTRTINIFDEQSVFVSKFGLMCATLSDVFYSTQECQSLLTDIAKVEQGEIAKAGTGLNARALEFTKDGAVFWFEFGPDGEETGGHVSLAQLKRAVETYARFLSDPERKPIEVEFPAA